LRRERLVELAGLRREGKKVIGYVSHLVPVEIIRAVGGVPVRLLRGGYDAETAGMSLLRPDACPHCLATLGNFALAAADSFYPFVDAFASVNTCDLSRRLPESIHHLFRLPVFELYLPRTAEPFSHRLAEFQRQLEWFGRELASFCGTAFDPGQLRTGIETENRLREQLRQLEASDPPPAESEILDLVTLATTMDPERFRLPCLEHRSDKSYLTYRADGGRPRLLLLGSELAEQDRWLIETIEAQADIVADVLAEGRAWFAEGCPAGSGPLSELARFYFSRLPGIFRRPNDDTYTRIRNLIGERRVQGMVLKTLLYCDPWNYEAVRLRREIGIPLLHIDGNYSLENREQVRTRIEAFLESLDTLNP
jgi:benzoyl-CoA reductase/2-hydroxyglutaryl-CoA dehydratase subunit BcrC/BadD/HgdB